MSLYVSLETLSSNRPENPTLLMAFLIPGIELLHVILAIWQTNALHELGLKLWCAFRMNLDMEVLAAFGIMQMAMLGFLR